MSRDERGSRFDEGEGIRKGGVNPAPSIPRPTEAPPAPQPSQETNPRDE